MNDKVMELCVRIVEGQSVLREEIKGLSTKVGRLEEQIENEAINNARTCEVNRDIHHDIMCTLTRFRAKLDVLHFYSKHIRGIR